MFLTYNFHISCLYLQWEPSEIKPRARAIDLTRSSGKHGVHPLDKSIEFFHVIAKKTSR